MAAVHLLIIGVSPKRDEVRRFYRLRAKQPEGRKAQRLPVNRPGSRWALRWVSDFSISQGKRKSLTPRRDQNECAARQSRSSESEPTKRLLSWSSCSFCDWHVGMT